MSAVPFRQAIVFGAGALGSYLGARLGTALRTTLVARPEHARAVREGGVRISGLADERLAVDAAETCPQAGERALLLVTVKLGDTAAAARAIAPSIRDDTAVYTAQNGLDPERVLSAALGGRPVVHTVTDVGATFEGPGHVSYWGGGMLLGPGERDDELAAVFAAAGIEVRRVGDMRVTAWKKMAANCVANPLSALTGRRNREIVTPALAPLRRMIAAEVAALAAAEGVTLDDDLADKIDEGLSGSNNVNSMLQDVMRGRPTEIDWLNGLVAERSAGRGLEAPVNRALAELVRLRSAAP